MSITSLRHLAAGAALAAAASPALAFDIEALQLLNQQQFRAVSEDLGAALSYKPLTPAEPLGITGFDIGLAVTGTSLKSVAELEQASGGDDVPSTLPVPTLRLHKGLPFGIDIGAALAAVPGSNIRYWGGEVRWAVLEGSTVMPAVGLRLAMTRLAGVDQLGLRTTSVDVSVSKGFAVLTPYAGVGQVWIKSTPEGVATLQEESFSKTKLYAGVNVNLLGSNVALEADRTGSVSSASVKLGFRF